jgi:hypothetical protein
VGICTACARIAFAYSSERRFIYTVFWVGPSDTPLRFPSSTLQRFISILIILLIIIITSAAAAAFFVTVIIIIIILQRSSVIVRVPALITIFTSPFFQLLAQPHIQSSV